MLNPISKYLIALTLSGVSLAEARQPVELSDGSSASDCASYTQKRQTLRVAESPRAAVAAADYLDCSLAWGGLDTGEASALQPVANALAAADIPTSLGPRVEGRMTFVALGAKFDPALKALVFEEDGQHLSIRFVQRKGNDFLVWVSDEILDAGYRAYFPVLLRWDGSKAAVSPWYPSGH
jgi:hypothetical protein